ncbi:hypothetical protein, partial [Elizabethkingia miricola]
MNRQELLKITRKHFNKFGLSAKSLGEITTLIEGSLDENSTDEDAIEQCKRFEPLASSYQADIDTRVTSA